MKAATTHTEHTLAFIYNLWTSEMLACPTQLTVQSLELHMPRQNHLIHQELVRNSISGYSCSSRRCDAKVISQTVAAHLRSGGVTNLLELLPESWLDECGA